MRKTSAATGSAIFFAVAPGMVAGVIPWWLTRWEMREPLPHWTPFRVLGALLLLVSVPVLVEAFTRFVREGAGTPAPIAPTERLVVGGLFRYVRNPMYLAVVGSIVGQALLLGRLELLAYAALMALTFAFWVRWYEEPTLKRQFGAPYDAYCRAVPRWWPRLRPWRPERAE